MSDPKSEQPQQPQYPEHPCIVVSQSHAKLLQDRIIVVSDQEFRALVQGLHPLYAKGIHDLFMFGIPNVILRGNVVKDIREKMHKPPIITPRGMQ